MKKIVNCILDVCAEKGMKREVALWLMTAVFFILLCFLAIGILVFVCLFPEIFGMTVCSVFLIIGILGMKRDITKEVDKINEKRTKEMTDGD